MRMSCLEQPSITGMGKLNLRLKAIQFSMSVKKFSRHSSGVLPVAQTPSKSGTRRIVRLLIIYDLVDSLGDRSLDVLEEHIKRITLPEDNNSIPKSRALCVQANLASHESEDARPSGLGPPVGPRLEGSWQGHSLGGAGVRRWKTKSQVKIRKNHPCRQAIGINIKSFDLLYLADKNDNPR